MPETEWKACRDLRLEALKEEPLAFGSSFEEEILFTQVEWQSRIHNAFFAFGTERLAGMIVYVCQSNMKAQHIANIYGLYVKKSFRGQGISSQLLEHTLAVLKSTFIKKVRLTVNPVQSAAHRLYNKYNFKEVGVLKNELFFEGKYYDEVIMELQL